MQSMNIASVQYISLKFQCLVCAPEFQGQLSHALEHMYIIVKCKPK